MRKHLLLTLFLLAVVALALPSCAQPAPATPDEEEVAPTEEEAAPAEEEAAATEEEAAPAEEEAATTEAPAELTPLRVAISGFQDVLSLKIAERYGWFEEAGLDVELIEADWPEAHELLAAGAVDVCNSSGVDVMTRRNQVEGIIFAIPLWFFQGHALQVRPDEGYTTYEEFLADLGDPEEAAKATMEQLRGKTIIVTRGSGVEPSVILFAQIAGLTYPDDFSLLDMTHEEGLAAFLAGEGDAYVGGIPQRIRGLQEGNKILIADSNFPQTIDHAGFATTQAFADANMDALAAFWSVIFRTLQYIEYRPDDAFAIIADEVNQRSGAGMTVADLKNIWNVLEYFPASGQQMYEDVIDPKGWMYYGPRFDWTLEYYTEQGAITEPVTVEEVYFVPTLLEYYMERYEPATYERIQ